MGELLLPIPILALFAALYAAAGYRFFNVYWEKFWLILLVLPWLAVLFYYWQNDVYARFWPGMWAQFLYLGSGYAMAPLYSSVRRTSILKMQQARDREGAAVAASLERSSEVARDFGLYLRPFSVTSNLPTSLPGGYSTGSSFDGVLDFEAVLEDALRDTMHLFALGHPLETYGAGRILTDDKHWQAEVVRLIEKSRSIFVIPSNHPGTSWEIEHILGHGLIAKCIFIMPPVGAVRWTREPGAIWHYDRALVDEAHDWAQSADALRSLELHLPPYEQSGALFTMNPSGELLHYARLPLLLPRFMGVGGYLHAIRDAIAQLQENSAILPAAVPAMPPAADTGFLAGEQEEYDITPGGFEVKFTARTWRGKTGCALFAVLFLLVGAFWLLHFKATLLFVAETWVAGILLAICGKFLRALPGD